MKLDIQDNPLENEEDDEKKMESSIKLNTVVL
jgi:hypothetical protein